MCLGAKDGGHFLPTCAHDPRRVVDAMSSAPYDRTLLAQAPVATRAQLQEGYDSVLLAPNRRAKGNESDIALELKERPQQRVKPVSSPWGWRKPVLGLLIALVVIAAIVGGAVGATARKKRTSTSDSEVTGDAGIGTDPLASASIFVTLPPTASSSISSVSSQSHVASFSPDSVAVATNPPAASDIFPQVTARHFVTARRR
ncbi:hypothetical protein B0H11DRAFT_766913 [Mycena galericulata]|nr:hypothetical protein B0H11DRAFT_766913 [Mycena galericulata]